MFTFSVSRIDSSAMKCDKVQFFGIQRQQDRLRTDNIQSFSAGSTMRLVAIVPTQGPQGCSQIDPSYVRLV